jgi:Tfp pilus assembly protein PilF
LRDLVVKSLADAQTSYAQHESEAQAAREGDALVNLGFSLVTDGKYDKGLSLMEQGLAKGNLKHPEDAKLRLGIAYVIAGKKQKGRDLLRTVKGADGTQDVARLWLIQSGTTT